jgi:hypothetical protein
MLTLGTLAGAPVLPDCLRTLNDPDAGPVAGLPSIWFTSVNIELVKHAAYALPSWYSATVNGPRTSVRTVCHAPGLPSRRSVVGPLSSWLWQSAVAVAEGIVSEAGIALQPAYAAGALPSTTTDKTVPAVAAPATTPTATGVRARDPRGR